MNRISQWMDWLSPALRTWFRALVVMIILAALAHFVAAQDMRVYTTVSALEGEQEQVVSHSLTLFHAGKVYDYLEDVGEVVILESPRNRFIILGGNYTATEVPFSEVHQFLDAAQSKTDEYLAEIRKQGDADQVQRCQAIAFQMNPELSTQFDASRKILSLHGEFLSYRVQTGTSPSAEFLNHYLMYADWAARLNYVLHPRSAYPTARIQLDQELRNQGLLPVTVELAAKFEHPVHLRARHDYRPIQPIDRQLINRWEQQLQSEETRWITLHEYQQKLLTAKAR